MLGGKSNPFDGRSSENYARARIVYIQKRKLFKRYILYDRLFNCLTRLVQVDAKSRPRHPHACRVLRSLCASEHMTHRAAGLRLESLTRKAVPRLASEFRSDLGAVLLQRVRFPNEFPGSQMNPAQTNIQVSLSILAT